MIDLYAAGTSNGLRARMALEECALPYTLHPISLEKGEHKTPQFLAMNPNCQIQVIVDREGPAGQPLTLSQSTAILIYCAEKTGRFIPTGPTARAALWQALSNASTDVTPAVGAIFAVVRSKDPHGPTADMFKSRFRDYMKVWDAKLAVQKYAAGGEFTIADISLYAAYARILGVLPAVCEGFPNVTRWAGEMGARPAMQRAQKF